MQDLINQVLEVLHVAQPEMQIAASSAFLQILQKDIVPVQNYTQTFLQTILSGLDSKDPDVANAWLETLLDVVELLPKEIIKREVSFGEEYMNGLKISFVYLLFSEMGFELYDCQTKYAIEDQLEATKSAILPELVELANDEESYVRLAGIETVVNILSLLDDETCNATIIPLVCKFCQQSLQNEDPTLPVVAKLIGKLCHGLSVNLTEDQKQWFLDFYRKLSRVGLSEKTKTPREGEPLNSPAKVPVIASIFPDEDRAVECRKNAAFNFPAMVVMTGARQFKTELYPTFSSLCNDPHLAVKKTIAHSFHEVVKLLGSSVHCVQGELISLLKDESIEILRGLVPHITETLDYMVKAGGSAITEAKMNAMSDVIPALLACETVLSGSNDWRLHAQIMESFSCLPKVFTSDQIYFKFIPLLFKKLQTVRPLPVRHAAARTILILIRNNRKMEHRQELICRLVDEYCHGKSCYKRSLFIDICKMAMELYSKSFFKEYFFEFVLEHATDPVPNIRLRLCSVLPRLKTILRLPADRNLLQQLESCVRKLLINERDRDVTASVRKSVEELDKITVPMDSMGRKTTVDDDIVDQRKEEEEKMLIEMEEKSRKDEPETKSSKKEEGKKKDKKDVACKIPAPKRASKIPAATSTRHQLEKSRSERELKAGSSNENTTPSKGNKTVKSLKNTTPSPTSKSRSPGSASSIGSACSTNSRRSSASSTYSSSSSVPSPSPSSAGRRRLNTGSPLSIASPDSSSYSTTNGGTAQKKNSQPGVSGVPTAKRKTSMSK
ncbi:serine/threonine-protein phosphatase 4 regulatory subunit 4-like [Lingula anatina]|uniref:Serine/threonine-protein phosphatase 4 regulatory subunit 4-like n=1 Tax=Lingula anatina TaxID=7574 RepID=A0A1S3ICL6_LINAN|nr:serine/threonine-protein phosphatase 4 regulatory subunit 4-like [Lingula anatina]|eukprot:XP_013395913.1 serine/threonine-protein phosphatase 4 regulatory subunit 4-like [Lingula anatina]